MADIGRTASEGLTLAQKFFVVGVVAIILISIAVSISKSMNNGSTATYDQIIGPFLQYWPLTAMLIAIGIGLYVLVPIVKKLMTELAA